MTMRTEEIGRLRRWLVGPAGAVGFLTVLPVPRGAARDGLLNGTVFFPLVGLLSGAVVVGVHQVAGGDLLAAALAVAAGSVLTGGLHEDAWADVMDSVGAPGGVDRRLEVLKDPRVGAHALWTTILLLLMRVIAVSEVSAIVIITGAMLGRLGMVFTLRFAHPLPGSTLGRSMRERARPLLASALAVAIFAPLQGLLLPDRAMPWTIAAGVAGGAVFAVVVGRRLGGFGGDAHGATGLFVETSCWVAGALVT